MLMVSLDRAWPLLGTGQEKDSYNMYTSNAVPAQSGTSYTHIFQTDRAAHELANVSAA